ncbi:MULTISPECIES: molecular chaperone [Pseudomonas]|uniref:fimbrial biogenesis chaperone n=1 Tax=Pseudomonas TaxID=286 RepID=UPI0003FD84E9|nr:MULTISPECIES: molecular chaperone [Pseudomonas]MBC3497043.1 molecular chaperone [Pseudomonas sp. SWRI67]MBV4527748.1 molecular chaperone [Pseudomonas kermanshahensis]SMF30395.1 fimbrial chaperone protein [Pseudomonas sp. LAIL14HWK12:I11]SMR78187.1 fimbrial chaperone protein [Pseudomonas sp. LAIL14HWK12:I10]SOD04485.1 fimbrial chaperone protein [Pseudomonas sp. LAIL14HWK12:I8]
MWAGAKWARGLIGLSLLASLPAGAATSVLIWPIDPVLEADQKAGALWLENRGTAPANLQVRVFAWRQGDYQEQFQAQRDIIGSPPVANIAPGQKQLIRLTRTGSSPAGQEQAYRIIIDEIPPAVPADNASQGATAAIRLQMRYSVPLFVYGEGLWGKADPEGKRNAEGVGKPQLSWHAVTVQGKPYVELRNTGPVHARLTDVVVQQGSQSKPLAEGLLGYVLPGASMRWPAPMAPSAGSVLKGRVNGQNVADAIRQGQ